MSEFKTANFELFDVPVYVKAGGKIVAQLESLDIVGKSASYRFLKELSPAEKRRLTRSVCENIGLWDPGVWKYSSQEFGIKGPNGYTESRFRISNKWDNGILNFHYIGSDANYFDRILGLIEKGIQEFKSPQRS
jgi:hypothetical protein